MESTEGLLLAEEQTVVYALPDRGIAFSLTPSAEGPDYSAQEIVDKPALIEGMVLGRLRVVEQSHQELPPGDYAITLAGDGETVDFTSEDEVARFKAVIRELPQPFSQPIALITASQMGLAWETVQICALITTRLPDELIERLKGAINNLQEAGILQAGEEAFILERAVPGLGNRESLERCLEALDEADYRACPANLLVAPAVEDGAFPVPPEREESLGIGLLVAMTDLGGDDLFRDFNLEEPVTFLPAGDYLLSEVRSDELRQTAEGVYEARGLLSGPAGDFFVPALGGLVALGEPLRGSAPSGKDEVIIWRTCKEKVRSRCKVRR